MAKKRSILDRYTASQKYIVSRGKALTFPASPFKKELKNDEVYGAVIDMPMSADCSVDTGMLRKRCCKPVFQSGRRICKRCGTLQRRCTGFI